MSGFGVPGAKEYVAGLSDVSVPAAPQPAPPLRDLTTIANPDVWLCVSTMHDWTVIGVFATRDDAVAAASDTWHQAIQGIPFGWLGWD